MSTTSTCVVGDHHAGGDGPPILLLHSLAMDRSLWDPHLAELTALGDVITCDLPGHGESCAVTDTTIESMADEVAAFLAEQAGGPAIVCGLSLGGCVAQALAIHHPDAVAGLVLVDTTPWYGEDASERWAERAEKARKKGFDSLAQFQLDRWFSPGFADAHPEVGPGLLDVFRSNDPASYSAVCHAMGAMDLRDGVASVTVPTKVLVGELDPATPVAMAEDLADRIQGADLAVLEGCSHLSPVERPDTFSAAVHEVAQRLAGTAQGG